MKAGAGTRDYYAVICVDGRSNFHTTNLSIALEHFDKPWSENRKAVKVFHIRESYVIEEVHRIAGVAS